MMECRALDRAILQRASLLLSRLPLSRHCPLPFHCFSSYSPFFHLPASISTPLPLQPPLPHPPPLVASIVTPPDHPHQPLASGGAETPVLGSHLHPLLLSPSTSSSSSSSVVRSSSYSIDSRFLECCEAGERLKIGVLVSGGVDSSVALRLLLAAGHSCTAFYLKIWFQEDFQNFWSSCPWDEDLKFAQAVCDEVGVDLHVVQLTEEYWKHVVSHMIAEYNAGRTPNPDVLCNSRIKFGVFLDHVKNMGFDRIASGHYAKVVRDGGGTVLQLSKDEVKDQTYFLSHLSQFQLLQLTFPLGCLSKSEVRKIAEDLELPNKQRKDSQGICFLGKVKFSDFIFRHLGEREGKILEAESGKYLGNHKGFWFYTIGQRQGLRLSNGPWYVVDKDLENNVIFVSREYYSTEKRRRRFQVHTFNWLAGQPPNHLSGLRCKVRHGPRFYECKLSFQSMDGIAENGESRITALVELSEDDQGIAAGQYAAFYTGNVCLGSAVISELKVDHGSAVSVVAREAARSTDLSVPRMRKSRKETMIPQHRGSKHETKNIPKDPGCVVDSLRSWMKKCLDWLRPS